MEVEGVDNVGSSRFISMYFGYFSIYLEIIHRKIMSEFQLVEPEVAVPKIVFVRFVNEIMP